MLINTVILLLRDLLPLFILFAFLRAFIIPEAFYYKNMRNVAVSSFLFVLLFVQIVEPISEWLNGAGLELMQVGLITLSFLSLVVVTLASINTKKSSLIIVLTNLAMEVLIVVKTSNFFIFLHVYLQDKAQVVNVFTGIVLGLGICLSFGAIFYYLLKEWQDSSAKVLLYGAWFLFLTGIITEVLPLLAQVDLLTLSSPLWSTEHVVANSSEYGQLLAALVGYQSAPSTEYLVFYCGVFLSLLLLTIARYLFSQKHRGTTDE